MSEFKKRIYQSVLQSHMNDCRQMAFVAGPRQSGKTTVSKQLADVYFDWDHIQHAELISSGPASVVQSLGSPQLEEKKSGEEARSRLLVFDELHKFSRWKQFLKGFYDTYGSEFRAIVTGSSRLDVYRRGGDSLMGRYFLYRMHPFSVGELASYELPGSMPIRQPKNINSDDFSALWEHGGFPDPFVKRSVTFSRRWRSQRQERFLREDLRDLTRVQELSQLDLLAQLLASRSGEQLIYSKLASDVRVSQDTIRRWVDILCSLHYGFLVRPWYRNVSKALRKEPKWFMRDWSGIEDPGSRAETFVACHLLKAVEGWTDLGLGTFELRYLRDRQKREVDFIVICDGKPWFLVEVKYANKELSPALAYFQQATLAAHAFQVVINSDYVDADCFEHKQPIVVPARTFLSQLF